MRIKNAICLAIANSNLIYKSLIFKVIAFALFSAMSLTILNIGLAPILDNLHLVFQEFSNLVTETINNPSSNNALDPFENSLVNFASIISSNTQNIIVTIILIQVVFLLFEFLNNICDSVCLISINQYMTSLIKPSFIRTLIENLKAITYYQLVYSAISFVYNFSATSVCYFIFILIFNYIPLASLFILTLLALCLITLKQVLFGQSMCYCLLSKGRLSSSLQKGLTCLKPHFKKMFFAYFVVFTIWLYAIITGFVFTFGVALIVFIPFFCLVMLSLRAIDYFNITKRKYYIDYDNIVVPKELRPNDEKLLTDVEI